MFSPLPAAPTNLVTTATSATQISLSWTAPVGGGVDHYEVARSQSVNGPYTVIGTPTATTFLDTAVSTGTAYLYLVRAVDVAGNGSAFSNTILAYAFTFFEDPLTQYATTVKARHITELRSAVNAARATMGLASATWTNNPLLAVAYASDVQDLRTSLDQAIGPPSPPYTDQPLASGAAGTRIKAQHITELRGRLKGSIPSSTTGKCGASGRPTDQYVSNSYQTVLVRLPNATELPYWNGTLQQGFFQGQGALLVAAQRFLGALFQSQEYIGRNRLDRDYVSDLYWAYFLRAPDQSGWDYWTNQLAPPPGGGGQSRPAVLRAFSTHVEFTSKVSTLCPNGPTSTGSSGTNFEVARLDPNNRTGEPGEDLLSFNYNWSLPVVGLPGRAGLDLGLALTYNSLVWTKSGTTAIGFDADRGFPAPGFRLGFPVVESQYYNPQVADYAYLLILPTGGRVELRRVGTSNIYESADSSYIQLTDLGGGSLLVQTADGTQLSYTLTGGEYRCTQVKDRNGNFITAAYDGAGDLTTITDTLGRVITFNYDGYGNLLTITQPWNMDGVTTKTHTWASFGYGTQLINPGFTGLTVTGPTNTSITVLTQVGLADGSYYTFAYNAFGQVTGIRRFTSDSVQRSYITYDYLATTSDCPRISARHDWADNWNLVNNVATEVVTNYKIDTDQAHMATLPDTTVYKEYYGTSTWQNGLLAQAEFWGTVNGVFGRQKWTTLSWTQDNTTLSYRQNPRVQESNVNDPNNRQRTTIGYQTFTLPNGTACNLPNDVYEYQANAVSNLRRTHTDYVTDPNYLNRYLVGLVLDTFVDDGSGSVASIASKVDYKYDAGAEFMQNQGAATQHDETNYGIGLVVGRGNLTSVRRWNANAPLDNLQAITVTSTGYDTAGCHIFTRDALNHQTTISYADSFAADGATHPLTLAYPTQVTDPDGFVATAQYNYSMGGVTQMIGPPPQGPPPGYTQGAIQATAYDDAGRVSQVTNLVNQAHTRYVYGTYYVQSYTNVTDTATEAYLIHTFDGVGRVRGTAAYHIGSTGGYKGQYTKYDVMGRVSGQSNPAEIDVNWNPTGDDAAGWVYTTQTYDWKGRPLVTTNTDGTQKTISYTGCGCAGGDVVTAIDEAGRKQVVTKDVVGRISKTQVYNFDGTNVYATTVNTYDVLDRVTRIRQYQGLDTNPTPTFQDTVMGYSDGYGRLTSRQLTLLLRSHH